MPTYPGFDPTSRGQVIDPMPRIKIDIGAILSRAVDSVRGKSNAEKAKHQQLNGLARRVESGGWEISRLGKSQQRDANAVGRDVDIGNPTGELRSTQNARNQGAKVQRALQAVGATAKDPDVKVKAPDFDSIRAAGDKAKRDIDRENRRMPPEPKIK